MAEFIGYSSVRPNYAALIEIPLRLKEHAAAKREAALQPQAKLAEIERQAMLRPASMRRRRSWPRRAISWPSSTTRWKKKRDMLRKIDEARVALTTGNSDPTYNEALNTIASADAADSLANLYAEARRTPTPVDEAIVGRLEGIDRKITETETEIAGLRREAIELSRRRSEMEQARERFRRSGCDHPQSTFNNNGDIADVLKGMLEGVVRSGVLWDLLQQGHRSRPTRGSIDFGLPNFPLPFPLPGGDTNDAPGGDWRNPSSRGGRSPGQPDGSANDNDFSTGGSF